MADTKSLLDAIHRVSGPSAGEPNDYQIALAVGPAYIARNRAGLPALLIPLESVPTGASRRGGGFLLAPADRVAFEYEARRWVQPAATLECTEPHLLEAFLVLASDIAGKLAANTISIGWHEIVKWVEEWQTLLARQTPLTPEQQLGLWGELWVISSARQPDLLIAAWRGPDQEAADFFLNGLGLEVKASRQPHKHHVSKRQVEDPMGQHECYLLSIWAGVDPTRGSSLPELFDGLLSKASDPRELLMKASSLGYSPADRDEYPTRWTLLERPRWYRHEDVPRIRAMDSGISQVRYVVALDPERSIAEESTHDLWAHFCAAEPKVITS